MKTQNTPLALRLEPSPGSDIGDCFDQAAIKTRAPWWRRDRFGYPIETFVGKPAKSLVRLLCQNIRKITG